MTSRIRQHIVVLGLVYAVHLGLVIYACPYDVFFGGDPVMGVDYQTHFEQTRTVSEAITRFGKTWAYDPNLLAGQPAGLIFDVDNKAHCLLTHALSQLGLQQAVAFNLFILLAHLFAPLAVLLAATLLGASPRARATSLGLAIMVWHFDSAARWYWWDGMISYVTAASVSLVVVALFHRLLHGGRARIFLPPLLVLLPLALLIHVWAFAILAVPMIGLYVRRWRTLGGGDHARVWGLALVALAVNLFWLVPALTHIDLLAPSGRGGQATPLHALSDYLDLYVDGLITGTIGVRTFWRVLVIAGAVITLWRWRKDRDERLFTCALWFCWTLGSAYLLALIPGVRETEPYRFIFPASMMAALLAGPWLAGVLRRSFWRELPAQARVVLLVLLVLLAPRIVRSVTDFMPELTPVATAPQPTSENPRGLTPVMHSFYLRHDPIPKSYRLIADYLDKECTDEGRVLVWWWVMAEYLRWATDKPIIGGFPDRRMKHEAANIFRYMPDPRSKDVRSFADYLVRYNIRYMVVSSPLRIKEERFTRLMNVKKVFGIGGARVYRIRHRADYFMRGKGKVTASLNRIQVRDAVPEEGTQRVILRFHHMRTLGCSPGCRVLKAPISYDQVGFIGVEGTPTLPKNFVVENNY